MNTIEKLNRLKTALPKLEIDLEAGEILNRTPFTGGTKYLIVTVNSEHFFVHQIIAVAGGLDILGMTVNHKDGNKMNNSIHNLEVLSRVDNILHAYRELGYGHNHDIVLELHKTGLSHSKIAKQTGIPLSTVKYAIYKKARR